MWYKRIKQGYFELICRLCLRKLLSAKVPIFEEFINEEESVSMPKLIQYCTDMKMSQNDQLPKFICTVCKNKLLEYTEFRQKCLKSKETLENILKTYQLNNTIKSEVVSSTEDLSNENKNIRDIRENQSYNERELQEDENIDDESDELNQNRTNPIKTCRKISTEKNDSYDNSFDIQSLCKFKCIEVEETKAEQVHDLKSETLDIKQQSEDTEVNHKPDLKNKNEENQEISLEQCSSINDRLNDEDDDDDDEEDDDEEDDDDDDDVEMSNLNDDHEIKGKSKSSLQKNNNNKKSKNKQRQCQICGKMYNGLYYHMLMHNNIRRHKCTICDAAFTRNCELKKHLLIHSNERPFKCSHCEKGFNSRQSLKAHELHHTKVMNYECDICKRKFVYNSTLQYHKKNHYQNRPHKCDICSKDFIAKCDLRQHYHIHTGEKPYECKECGKKFAQRSGLSIHKKTHS